MKLPPPLPSAWESLALVKVGGQKSISLELLEDVLFGDFVVFVEMK